MKNISLFFFFNIIFIYAQNQNGENPKIKSPSFSSYSNNYTKNKKIKAIYSIKLSDSIKETSGLMLFNDLLWTHNDDHDKTIYGLDSLGKIKRKIVLNDIVNHDWEEISQDSTHIYIGDFGNNYAGNRSDLKIFKIEKQSFLDEKPKIETILFSYSNQTNFDPLKPNKTNFDCEAFIVSKDSIYLFTKQWKSSKTNIYSLPKTPGSHIAKLKSTLDTKGLVTGAVYLENKNLVALCGYTKIGKPFLYLLHNFKDFDFLSGNKLRIDLKLPFHQIEGIATKDGLHYFLTNESLVRKPIINVDQQLHYFDLSSDLSE